MTKPVETPTEETCPKTRYTKTLATIGGVIAAVILFGGCTPAQVSRWLDWRANDPVAADQFAHEVTAQRSGGNPRGPCSEWYWTAMDAGFSDAEWSTVSYLMSRESGCDPDAYNPSGATSLMQIMPMWADDCGTTPSGLFDPAVNLRCAVLVHNVQGWTAWSTYNG